MSIAGSENDVRRDGRITALVAGAHFWSHVMQLVLPPLFPILHDEFGVSFTQLGLVMTVFYVASGAGQTFAGILVDRYGAHTLLLLGTAALSVGIVLDGFAPSYWMLLPLALLSGLGNSVFHPADLSIINLRISERRHGRAYAMHGVLGALGYAAAPVLVTVIAAHGGWRLALIVCGLGGAAWTALLYANRGLIACGGKRATAGRPQAAAAGGYLRVFTSPVIMMGFAFFALMSFSSQGIQAFGITALHTGYDLSLALATSALTAYLAGYAAGTFGGGFLADRTRQHHRVAMAGTGGDSLMMLAVSLLAGSGWIVLPLLALAGIGYGITQPSRDVLIRQAAAGAGTGSVFGFVYSGFDFGSCTAPLLFGAFLDHGQPQLVFVAVAASLALAVPTVMQVRHHIAARTATAAAD
ncbi:MAG TPA: MFS transporter [Alphaproteobacteria bacterium]